MTSTLVKGAQNAPYDVNSLMNYVKQENPTNFGDIMAKAASRTSENQSMPHRENLIKTTQAQAEKPQNDPPKRSEAEAPKAEAPKAEASKAEAPKELKNPDETKMDDRINQKMEEVAETAKEVLYTIASKFDITPEEVIEVLNTLGLIPESLLEPQVLSEVVVVLEGTDLLTLMTDDILYESFTELSNEVIPIIEELLHKTDLTPDEMKMLIAQLKLMESTQESEVNPDKLTESVNKVNEIADQQVNEPESKVTIVIERDGIITEVTAKADENGNVKATTDVAEISIEAKVEVKPQDSKHNEGQSENPNGERNANGYEAILNNLLGDRVNEVTAKFEPIVMEAPNTEQIINQILDFMKIKLTPEIDSLEMQLHPASLGTVSVKIASTAGVITAQFSAQNETVRAAIESQIIELRENMRAQGIKVEAIEVNVESQAFDSKLWQGKEENQGNEQDNRKNRRRINLNGLDELPEDLTGDEKLAAEMMVENGQTVDFSA